LWLGAFVAVSKLFTSKAHVAIVSGGLGDIGRAIALELARRGADVAVGDLAPPARARDLLRRITSIGRRARYDRVDVSHAGAVRRWVAAVEKHIGLPTLVIPNAAVVTLADSRSLDPAVWRRELSVNLDGAFHLARAAALRLVARRSPGRIVFVGSWAAHRPHPNIVAYSVSKAGLRMLCRCMALELAPSGILVNEVAPGYVDAGLSGRLFKADPELRKRCEQRVPSGRLLTAPDVAREVAHLCDPLNRHMTGSVVVLDGGLSLVSADRG
jgi:NAD(P)-dependent dehydrogenase (short-subunit alcohol dehydrogenase family)